MKLALKWSLLGLLILGGSALIISSPLGRPLIRNFHEVDPGKFYRSAQLKPDEFHDILKDYGIKTVINLRGAQPGQVWFENEKALAEVVGAQYISINMRSKEIPSRGGLLELLKAYREAPRPILVHCLSGVDRTGEAAALYKLLYQGKSKDEALEMLTLRYGYVSWAMPSKKYFMGLFQNEEWAKTNYYPCSGLFQYYDIKNFECQK